MAEESQDPGVSRRDLLKKAGLGGAAMLGGSLLGVAARDQAVAAESSPPDPYAETHSSMTVGDDVLGTIYRHGLGPPAGIDSDALRDVTFPPLPSRTVGATTHEIEMWAQERLIEVGHDIHVEAWAYNGLVPGPTIRATEGDTVRIRFTNRTGHPHSIHFHGRHRPDQDGWEPVPPGSETVYEIEAGPAGVHPYHCHTAPLSEHVARGLYGTMIVDPVGGRSPAQEVMLILSGFSNPDIGRNGVIAWNGIAGFYEHFPIKVARGEPVRAYVVNMLEYEPLASFHLHAQTFEVYPAGIGTSPVFSEDTIALTQGQRAMLEFILPEYGRYMFHPHQHWLAERGAVGWFAAV